MLGTFGGALEARQIDASGGRLTADVTGEVETEDGVLVIRRIHVAMRLAAPESRGQRWTASTASTPCAARSTAHSTTRSRSSSSVELIA